ncbi:hypothetical protein V1525DRAFT_397609 [Lipomyces kononenkoae]|uniref:Uncharacterized protein n=1 Tax=Lipomyces kononenkoae TaxID=34357 RepID=A0ACC3T746_LIPKO
MTAYGQMIILRSLRIWYLFGFVVVATGLMNKLFILPRFLALVHARMEFNAYVLDLVVRMNSKLCNLVVAKPKTEQFRMTSLKGGINGQTYVNAQTQTEGEEESASTTVPDMYDCKEPSTNSADSLPLSYYTLRQLSQSLKRVPGLFATPGYSSANYSTKELNLLIESLNFAGATGGKGNSVGLNVSQVKGLATQLMEDIRYLKSLALKV